MRKILLLFLILYLSGGISAIAQPDDHFYFSNLGLKEGLSQISVVKILQDSKGYMWFGTRNGLNKYDGARFTVYKHHYADPFSLTDNHITALTEDKEGNLWIGTISGLNKLNLRTNQNTPYLKDKCNLFADGIRSLCVDSKKRLWVGTSKGLCLYVKEMNQFQIVDLNDRIKGEFISVIYETHDHKLIIGTASQGFFVCDINLKVLKHYPDNLVDPALTDRNVATLHEDSEHRLWIGYTYSGIARINLENDEVVSFTKENSELTSNSIRCFAEHEGTLFIGTFDGLYAIDPATGSMVKHSNANLEKGNLSHYSIYSLCIDNSGTVWVGSYSGGVNYSSRYNNRFRFHEPAYVFNTMMGIYGAMVGKENCLYIATEGGGLLDYNVRNSRYQYYQAERQSMYSQNIIKTVMLEDDIVWCGSNKGELYQFNSRSKKFSLFHILPRNVSVYSIYRALDGNLWVGTSDPEAGLVKITRDKKVQSEFTLADSGQKLKIPSVRCILELQKGVFLIGTRNNGLLKYDENNQTVVHYNTDQSGTSELLENYITTIVRTASREIWVGTFGGGIFRYDEKQGVAETITMNEGLIENDVCAIVEDRIQHLWISTSNGISKYDLQNRMFSNYEQFSGIGVHEFTPHSGTLLPNGNICFSGNNGFVTFDPEEISPNSFIPPLVLTGLVINNQPSEPSETGILHTVIDDAAGIKLTYDQNNISISYCALNYIFPDKNQYAYRLVGHDKEWNYVGNRKEAFYTNLGPGSYRFEVKASNNDGVWNEEIRTMDIIITPPWWKTWYAYLLYNFFAITIIGLILYYINSKLRLERELHYKQLEKQQLEEFHQTKIRLFTNFSHELRTPLTLILAPLQDLLKMTDFTQQVRNKLTLISGNAQRLLLLVNQLMDLRKNQAGKMQLKISKGDIYSYVEEIYYAFNQIAINKHIEFQYEKQGDYAEAWFDKSLFEKVVFNLLSNAFKYTPGGGKITLALKEIETEELDPTLRKELPAGKPGTKYIRLSVADTGKGIPASEVKNIFTPFYQIEENEQENGIGTGIGLSLTYSIVQLHHGMIQVEENTPTGVIFHVIIPVSREMYEESQFVEESPAIAAGEVLPSAHPEEKLPIEKQYTILLAEDNEEVRNYVKESLEPYFFIIETTNGADALERTIEKYPDLVISDIMMPRMDGLQLCSHIKNDIRTEHIPVILITAKSMVMHIKEGFSVGADDYIVKPFNIDVLIYRVRNLIESRQKLKQLYGKKFSPDSLGIEIVSGDDRFTQKFFSVIEEHIANPELNIDLLSREVGLSRANLYRKLKAITDLSPTELIRNKRLEVAAKLLSESTLSVSEVSVYVGFNSHAYFTNSFKTVYGISPTEFIQRHHNKQEPVTEIQ